MPKCRVLARPRKLGCLREPSRFSGDRLRGSKQRCNTEDAEFTKDAEKET
jgi:hypothetical protein